MVSEMICDKCGICCRLFDVLQFSDEVNKTLNNGKGCCKYLKDNNECSIYDNRPDICNSEWLYEREYKTIMSKEEYFEYMSKECKKLKQKWGDKINEG